MRTLLLFALLTWPAAAFAQDPLTAAPAAPYIGKRIASVRVTTEGRPTADAVVLELVRLRVGEPLAMTAVRETIAHLFTLGRFQDVQIEATGVDDGVGMTVNLIPLHGVSKVSFAGTLGLSEGLLRRTVESRFGSAPPVGRTPEVARMLREQLYPDHGYLRATVRPVAVEEHDPDRTLVTFEIDSGPRARIGQVEIEGEVGGRAAFLRRIGAAPGEPYEPLTITRELTEYADDLRKAGRYQALATFRPFLSEDRTQVDLTVEVDPGPVIAVRFEGDPVPRDRQDELVPVEQERSAHPDLIEDSELRIRNYLAQQGYWKATVSSSTEESDDRLTIVFTVKRGLQYQLSEPIELRGVRALPAAELRPLVASLEPGTVFLASALDAAAAQIQALYRERGFAQVAVSSSVTEQNPTAAGLGQVKPVIVVEEGPRTLVGQITFAGNTEIPAEGLRALIGSATGAAYVVPRLAADRDAIVFEYLNRGFGSVDVQVTPALSEDQSRADLAFMIVEGPQTIVDHIVIVGNTRTNPEVIRRELRFRPGEPLGLEDLIESRRRLTSLGLFRRVQISEIAHGEAGARDVLVTVEEAPSTTLSYGAGIEGTRRLRTGDTGFSEERFEFAPRGFFNIGRRNLGGKNRSINLFTRASVRRNDSSETEDGGLEFNEYRIVGSYREPRPYGFAGDLTITAAIEQGIRTSYSFERQGVTADVLRRLTPSVSVLARYSFSTTRTFDEAGLTDEEQATIDRAFPDVRLSIIAAAISRDTRDDLLDPTRGTLLSIETSLAARALGGELGFLKTYGQALWFYRIPRAPRVVFATRAAIGLADGFEREVPKTDAAGNPIPGETEVVEDLPASERFFAGGDTTVRGFALDTLGTPATISSTGFPLGGNAVVVLNSELRFPVWKSLGAAVFLDGGNVFDRVTNVDVGDLRGTAGFGLRYRSPLGPIRVDMGFKFDRQLLGDALEPRREIHFSFGQSF